MIFCPECSSADVYQTMPPDEDGLAEYHCGECGHYFVEEVSEEDDS